MMFELVINCQMCGVRRLVSNYSILRGFSTSQAYLMKRQEKPVLKYIGKHRSRAKRIYLWGNARTGALGIRKFLYPEEDKWQLLTQPKPYNFHWPIRAGLDVTHMAAGCGFSIFGGSMRENSLALFGFGINTDSQLGFHSENGTPVDYLLSQEAINLPVSSEQANAHLTSIACGRAHTVVATDKAVFTLGNNALGQCGRSIVEGEVYKGSRVIHVIERNDIIKVVCGYDHTLMLTNNGQVWSCGLGADGQTGLDSYKNTGELTQVKGDMEGAFIKDVACRADTVLAVSDKGELFGWGNSEYGQFDMATNDPQVNNPRYLPVDITCGKVEAVAVSGTSCAVVNDKGEVYVWGYGILGKGPKVQQSATPELLPMPLFGQTAFSTDVQVERIFGGLNFFAALNNQKNLFTWGRNIHGCLGLGHQDDQYFPFLVSIGSEVNEVACGADHMLTICRAYI